MIKGINVVDIDQFLFFVATVFILTIRVLDSRKTAVDIGLQVVEAILRTLIHSKLNIILYYFMAYLLVRC